MLHNGSPPFRPTRPGRGLCRGRETSARRLAFENLTDGCGSTTIVRDLSGGAVAGEVLCVLGRNGVGKTTLMKLSTGYLPCTSGHVLWNDAPITAYDPAARRRPGVPVGFDCISPSRHSAFSTPIEMLEFIATMRRLSGGKPAGFKLCIGHPWEFLAVCKAMVETEIYPDFIVVDGKEGGTGAAPLEFTELSETLTHLTSQPELIAKLATI